LFQPRPLRRAVGVLLGVSFAFNSLTSRSIVGDATADSLLSMGCVTIGTALVGVMIWFIVVDKARNGLNTESAARTAAA